MRKIIKYLLLSMLIIVNSSYGDEVVDKSLMKDLVWDSLKTSDLLDYNKKYPLFEPDYTFNSEYKTVIKFNDKFINFEDNIQVSPRKTYSDMDIFCYSITPLKIVKLTNLHIESILGVFLFKDNLIYTYFIGKEQKVCKTGIILIPRSNPLNVKYYQFEGYDCFGIYKIYPEGENLVMKVVTVRTNFNYEYLLLFWLPRGRPAKYDYEELCEYEYTFDKDLNLISKKLVKTFKK